MQKQPLLIICLCFVAGILFQDYFLLTEGAVYAVVAGGFLSLLLFLFRNFYFRKFRYVSLCILFFGLGVFAHSLNTQKPNLPSLKSNENLTFKLAKKLNANEKNRRYEIYAWKGNIGFRAVISVPRSEKPLDFLHYYKADILFNEIQKPYSDFQFDYARYLARQHIYHQGYIAGNIGFSERNDLSLPEKIRQQRLQTLGKLDSADWDKRSREFTKGIILADRTEMDAGTVQDFSTSGLTHILAISGSHMAVIFLIIIFVLKPFCPPRWYKMKYVLALVIIWLFSVFIDYGSSVVRSCIMLSTYYMYVLLQRKPDLLHAMALAAFILLIHDTNAFFDVGFQLSFAAVFGIFWFNKPILKYLPKPKNDFQTMMLSVFSLSIAAQIATLPLVIYYFHQYSYISLLANVVLVPFSQLLIIVSLLMTVLTAFSLNFWLLDVCYDFIVDMVLQSVHFFADADFAFVKMIPLSLPELLVSGVIIFFLRAVILNFNIRNSLRVVYFALLFLTLRLMLNYRAQRFDEVLVHEYYKEKLISVKEKDKVVFLIPETLEMERISKYIIEPYLTSRRTQNYEVRKIPESISQIRVLGKIYSFKDFK